MEQQLHHFVRIWGQDAQSQMWLWCILEWLTPPLPCTPSHNSSSHTNTSLLSHPQILTLKLGSLTSPLAHHHTPSECDSSWFTWWSSTPKVISMETRTHAVMVSGTVAAWEHGTAWGSQFSHLVNLERSMEGYIISVWSFSSLGTPPSSSTPYTSLTLHHMHT